MKRLLYFCFLFLVLGCSCTPADEKHLALLLEQLKITSADGSSPEVVIIIPGNGCASCIVDAMNNIKVSNDTAFVFVCHSEKEFFLQSKGKKASDYRNLFLDKKGISTGLGMVQSYPMVYFLSEGKFTSKEAYKPTKKNSIQSNQTIVELDRKVVDLGDIKMGGNYVDSLKITNLGEVDLNINEIQTSCECTEAQISKRIVAPTELTWLTITFRPENKGLFERYVYVYGNVKDSPIEISITGCVK